MGAPTVIGAGRTPARVRRLLELPHAIEVETFGEIGAGRPTIVMLHHGLGSVSSWRSFPRELAELTGLPVVAYSRRGYGRSAPTPDIPWPPDFMEREARGDLPALLATLGIDRPLLLGHSDGASIALLYAASGLEPVPLGTILLAPHLFVEEETLAGARAAGAAFGGGPLRKALAHHHRDPEAAFRGWQETWLSSGFRSWDIRPRLRAVRGPLLVVQGLADEYGTLAQVAPIAAGDGPPAEMLLLDRCGHAPERERPRTTFDAVAGFVAERTSVGRERAPRRVYHLATRDQLLRDLGPHRYRPDSLAGVGFVHCTRSPATVLALARDLFPDEPPVVLRIDTAALNSPMRMEPPAPVAGGTGHRTLVSRFPHLYGPVERPALTGAARLVALGEGYAWPAVLDPLDDHLATLGP